MLLEHMTLLSILILMVGFIGLLIRSEKIILLISMIVIAGALLIAVTAFAIYWKNVEGVSAVYLIITLLVVQIFTTMSVLFLENNN